MIIITISLFIVNYYLYQPFVFTENGFKAMKEMRLAMREVEVELPDEFGGYILTGATCYTTFPSCKMAVYTTVSVIVICNCSADTNADSNQASKTKNKICVREAMFIYEVGRHFILKFQFIAISSKMRQVFTMVYVFV